MLLENQFIRYIMKTIVKKFLYGFAAANLLLGISFNSNAQQVSKPASQGMNWPEAQLFPSFASPADTLDAITITNEHFTPDEINLFVVLQGLVNKTKPSIIILKPDREGKYTWPNNLGLFVREYQPEDNWELIRKYQKSVHGVVLYSTEKSPHYRNLAGTVAGLKNALPVTKAEYKKLQSMNINLPVLENLSGLAFTTAEDIYRHLYENYWKDCSRRLLISHQAPGFIEILLLLPVQQSFGWIRGKNRENDVLRLFLNDMKGRESIILGWWAEERSGIGIGTEYGISTIPADFYDNATVYAGMNHQIDLPVVPKKPKLENKIYVSVFLSDGDNIQYCQHTLPVLWNESGPGIRSYQLDG